MAAVKSAMLLVVSERLEDVVAVPEAVCRDGVLADFDFTFGKKSDIRDPDAEGGAFGVDLGGAGDWFRDDAADEIYGDAL